MKANKDGATSVGFSKTTPESYDGKRVYPYTLDEMAKEYGYGPTIIRGQYHVKEGETLDDAVKRHLAEVDDDKAQPMDFKCEHEWVGYLEHMDDKNSLMGMRCKKCDKKYKPPFPEPSHLLVPKEMVIIDGELKPPIDFHIAENVEIINRLEWEFIWDMFLKSDYFKNRGDRTIYEVYVQYLEKEYLAPEKK